MSISADQTYRVVVKGRINASNKEIAAKLASTLSATPSQIEAIIASPHHVLAKDLTRNQAEKYAALFEGSGVTAVVENEGERLAIELAGPDAAPALTPASAPESIIRRLADYQKASGILWIILAIIQICTIYGIIGGIWNLFVGVMRIKSSGKIRARDASIPAQFAGVGSLVLSGIINIVLGGVIGIILVGFDFYVRDKILSNQQLFDRICEAVDAYQLKKEKRLARLAAKGY